MGVLIIHFNNQGRLLFPYEIQIMGFWDPAKVHRSTASITGGTIVSEDYINGHAVNTEELPDAHIHAEENSHETDASTVRRSPRHTHMHADENADTMEVSEDNKGRRRSQRQNK